MTSQKLPILIVGATGKLGSVLTKHCLLKENYQVNILVRNPAKNKVLCKSIENSGGRVIKADVLNFESLKDCTKGIHTVISALIGDDNIVFNGQKAILDDGINNGLKRFVPCDFTIEYPLLHPEEQFLFDSRINFRKHLANSPVKGLHIFNGVFMEIFFWINSRGLTYHQFIDQKFDITTYEDAARYTAAALLDSDRIGDFRVSGNQLSITEITEIYNKIREKKIEQKNEGLLEELKKGLVAAKESGTWLTKIMLAIKLLSMDGRGLFQNTNNSEFPEIKSVTLEEFLERTSSKLGK